MPSLLSRRSLLKLSLAAPCIPGLRFAWAIPYEDLSSEKYLGEVETLVELSESKIFTEGPAYDGDDYIYFTNVPAHQIWWVKLSQPNSAGIFRQDSGGANGLHFDAQGRLLTCEGGRRRVARTDMKTGKVEVLAEKYNGKPVASPNDLCLDRKGRIYFTSRPQTADSNANGVYRIDPDGTLTQLLRSPEVHMPNGIVISPDDKTLYLIEAHPKADHNRNILAFDLQADGSLSNRRTLIDFYPGRSGDGMCIDSRGNLYVAAGLHKTRKTSETLDTKPGIHVISPQGKLLAFRETPADTITNCTFGGRDYKTLFVTCGPYLLKIPTKIAGKR